MNKSEITSEQYFHIDNGGFFVRVDKFGSIEIEFGFHGYSNTTIYMTVQKGFGPEELGNFLLKAALKNGVLS